MYCNTSTIYASFMPKADWWDYNMGYWSLMLLFNVHCMNVGLMKWNFLCSEQRSNGSAGRLVFIVVASKLISELFSLTLKNMELSLIFQRITNHFCGDHFILGSASLPEEWSSQSFGNRSIEWHLEIPPLDHIIPGCPTPTSRPPPHHH